MDRGPAVVAFARAPVSGRAKTRLVPALGPEGAAELYRCFLLDTLGALRELRCDIIVAAAEGEDVEPLSAALGAARVGAEVIVQSGADLGERIADAVRLALRRGHSSAVVIGTDAPDLPSDLIGRALDLTASHDVVLGPCADGGYYLVGLRAVMPSLFRNIEWSTETVLSQTLDRARELGLAVALLEPWNDVDTAADLLLLRERLTRQVVAGEPIPCPRTWDYLCDLSVVVDEGA